MKIEIGDRTVSTKYDIGDIVIVWDSCMHRKPESTMYRPKWRDDEKYDSINMRSYPVKVDIRYTITDIEVSAATGEYKYSLHYSNDRVIFPCGSRGVCESDIIMKVDTNDYESCIENEVN